MTVLLLEPPVPHSVVQTINSMASHHQPHQKYLLVAVLVQSLTTKCAGFLRHTWKVQETHSSKLGPPKALVCSISVPCVLCLGVARFQMPAAMHMLYAVSAWNLHVCRQYKSR